MVEKKKNWFRKHWILTSFLVLIILIIILGAFTPENSSPDNKIIKYEEVNKTNPVYQKQISEIEQKYNINIEYENPPHSSYPGSNFVILSGDDEAGLAKYVALFYEEFNKYPQDFIKNVDLREVIFAKNLSVTFEPEGKTVNPSGYQDVANEFLFYDIYLGDYNEIYQREVIHHEFYHLIEEEINGDAYYKDPVWASFNDPDFKYGSGSLSAYTDTEYEKKVPESGGFISVYSTYGIGEDKAEIFANLMVSELSGKLYSLAEKDDILAKKVAYMKDFLSKHSEHMNEDFWQNIKK